jgi:hypothetical protein
MIMMMIIYMLLLVLLIEDPTLNYYISSPIKYRLISKYVNIKI